MVRLHDFLSRHRRFVLVAWLLVLVAAAPFASRQTEHLTSGGFLVPGSGSEQVDQALADFEGAQRETLAVVLAQREGATPEAIRAEIDRVDRIAAEVDHTELTPTAAREAKARAGQHTILVIPLDARGSHDELADAAVDMRDELDVGVARDGVEPHLVGQQALWAGMQVLQQEDLAKAEGLGFPAILIVLLVVFGSLLAALLPVGLGVAAVMVTGAAVYFLALATTTIAPIASDRMTVELSRNSPAKETSTVMPEKTTVAPEVRIATSSACARSLPPATSSRYRDSRNSE